MLTAMAVSLVVFSCSNPMELGSDAVSVPKDFRALSADPRVELVQATSFVHFKYGSNLQRTITARVRPKA